MIVRTARLVAGHTLSVSPDCSWGESRPSGCVHQDVCTCRCAAADPGLLACRGSEVSARPHPKGEALPGSMAQRGAGAKLSLSVWACCDNSRCSKWRRLPPGTVVDPNKPWCVALPSLSGLAEALSARGLRAMCVHDAAPLAGSATRTPTSPVTRAMRRRRCAAPLTACSPVAALDTQAPACSVRRRGPRVDAVDRGFVDLDGSSLTVPACKTVWPRTAPPRCVPGKLPATGSA